ncbi:hypothetical protein [Burkholderia stagnalis]|uniref:hypothetical protein n=1 Tax=Burkholderia stagnalis TaxID=1503054 RepID=UPI000B1CF976|nr:hypothetical protein [Burkholderia stagnalis]
MTTTYNETRRIDALMACIGTVLFEAGNVISAVRARARDDADIEALERAVQSARTLLTASPAEPPACSNGQLDRPGSGQARACRDIFDVSGARATVDARMLRSGDSERSHGAESSLPRRSARTRAGMRLYRERSAPVR